MYLSYAVVLCCYSTALRCPTCLIIWYSVLGHEKLFFLHLCASFASLILKVFKKLSLNSVHFLSVQVGGSKTGFFFLNQFCVLTALCVSWCAFCQCILDLSAFTDLCSVCWSLWQLLHIFICTLTASAFRGIHLLPFLLLDMEILLKKVVKCPDIFSTCWLEFFTTSLVSSRFSLQDFSFVDRRSILLDFWGNNENVQNLSKKKPV